MVVRWGRRCAAVGLGLCVSLSGSVVTRSGVAAAVDGDGSADVAAAVVVPDPPVQVPGVPAPLSPPVAVPDPLPVGELVAEVSGSVELSDRVPVGAVGRPGVSRTAKGSSLVEVRLRGTRASGLAAVGVSVDVFSEGVSRSGGLDRLGFSLSRSDAGDDVVPVSVVVNYSALVALYGTEWAARLRVAHVPACGFAAEGAVKAGRCRAVELDVPTRNDLGSFALTMDVDLLPRSRASALAGSVVHPVTGVVVDASLPVVAPGRARLLVGPGAGGGFGLTSGSSSPLGDWAASSLGTASKWDVGLQTGSFSWSYPIPVPPPLAGSAPSLALSYNSGAIDGMTSESNNQGSVVGAGWELSGLGFIERRYKSCSADGGAIQDLCWFSDNATISLGGHATELIPVGAGPGGWPEYRLKDDPGWRVRRVSGCTTGCGSPGGDPSFGDGAQGGPLRDNDQEFWEVRSPDGTTYVFGLGREPETSVFTNSVWTVPVYGNQAGEPCFGSWCYQGWRWNLDRIIDSNGRITTFYWSPEMNKYGLGGGSSGVQYVRGGWLAGIQYGRPAGGGVPGGVVTFAVENRCQTLNAACVGYEPNPSNTAWFDVPFDYGCLTATCTKNVPTFWTQKRLTGISTFSVFVDAASATVWQPVDVFAITHEFPAVDAAPKLFVRYIRRLTDPDPGTGSGLDPLAAVRFDSASKLANRADPNPGQGVPVMEVWRIDQVADELGGKVNVTYGRPHGCDLAVLAAGNFDLNPYDCFASYYAPQGGTPGFGVFNKYLVTSSTVRGDSYSAFTDGGSPPVTTSYTYLNPGWHYADDPVSPLSTQTWNDFRGFSDVIVTTGSNVPAGSVIRTHHRFFQGMNGDRCGATRGVCSAGTKTVVLDTYVPNGTNDSVADDNWLRGRVREVRHNDANDVMYRSETTRYTVVTATAGSPPAAGTARIVQPDLERTFAKTGAVWDGTTTGWAYNTWGLPLSRNDNGDVRLGGRQRCEFWSYYTPNDVATGNHLTPVYQHGVMEPNCATGTGRSLETSYYDGLNTASGTEIIAAGNVTRLIRAANGGAQGPNEDTFYEYEPTLYKRPTKVTDGRGGVTETVYGAPATTSPGLRVVTVKRLLTPTVSHDTATTIDPRWGAPTKVVDPNGKITDATYDLLGRLRTVTRPAWSSTPVLKYDYFPAVPPVGAPGPGTSWNGVRTWTLKSGSNADQAIVFNDSLGRARQQQYNTGLTNMATVHTTYNDRGMTDRVLHPIPTVGQQAGYGFPALPALASTLLEQVSTYDPLGRPTATQTRKNNTVLRTTQVAYDGYTTTSTPPTGGATDQRTDGWGALRTVVEHDGAALYTTSYGYDALNRLTSMTDHAGNVTTSTYDMLGRRLSSNDPDQGATQYWYDTVSNLQKVTDANSQTRWYVYDLFNRKTEERVDTVSGQVLAQWVWDQNVPKGMLRHACAGACGTLVPTYQYDTYDELYRPTAVLAEVPSSWGFGNVTAAYPTWSMFYSRATYDTAGNRTQAVLPQLAATVPAYNSAGETVNAGFNQLAQPTTLAGPSNTPTYVVGTVFNTFGELVRREQRTTATPGASTVHRWFDYDDLHRTKTVATYIGGTVPATYDPPTAYTARPQFSQYFYDTNDNVKVIADYSTTSGSLQQQQCFTYDPLNRLTRAYTNSFAAGATCASAPDSNGTGAYDQTFAYNPIGNITTTTGTNGYGFYCYNPSGAGSVRPHAVAFTTSGNCTAGPSVNGYEYDAAGQMTRRLVAGIDTKLVWDRRHQICATAPYTTSTLTCAVTGANTTRNQYDANGQRVLRETTNNANQTDKTLYFDGIEVRKPASGALVYTRYYTHGTVTIGMRQGTTGTTTDTLTWLTGDRQTNQAIAVVNGTTTATVQQYLPYGGLRGGNNLTTTDRGFLGQTEDPTGLDYLNTRYYDPTLARFISVDPLVAMTGEAYSYGGNNPVANSDPSGLCWGWNLVCKAATVAVYTYDHTTRIVTDPAQLVSAVSSPLNTALETFSAFEGIVVDGADLKRSGEYCGRIAECLLGADALGDADATTIGHTIRFRAHDPAPGLEAHETQHVYDSELLGDMFYPLYLGEEALRVATPIDGGYNDLWSEKRAYWVSYNYDDGYRPGYQGPRCNGIGACAVPGFVPHTTWPEGDPHDHWGPTSVADAAGFAAGFA